MARKAHRHEPKVRPLSNLKTTLGGSTVNRDDHNHPFRA
jgi:hypothetical protein